VKLVPCLSPTRAQSRNDPQVISAVAPFGITLHPKKGGGEILIHDSSIVQALKTQHITEIKYLERLNRKATNRKLDAEKYVVLSTGEVKRYNEGIENRAQNENSLRKSFRRLRNLIRENYEGSEYELMITLTYANNMTDIKTLYDDVERFIRQMRRLYGHFEYLAIVEPQQRGAWHVHILTKWTDPITLDNNTKVYPVWEKGWTHTQRLTQVDDIGAYVTAYLTDLPLDQADSQVLREFETVEKAGKKYVKGARLQFYPPGMNLYRRSKGIKDPEIEYLTFKKAKKKYSLETPTFEKEYSYDNDQFSNKIVYQQYNQKRSKKEGDQNKDKNGF